MAANSVVSKQPQRDSTNSETEIKKEELDKGESVSSSSTDISLLSLTSLERERWTNQLDFFVSCVGFAVGLGNVWRFPYLCYSSGGGAFLIPYTVFLFTCAIPLFFMEISLGQFASLSPISIWKICPLFKGIGYGMVMVSALVCVYYNVIMTWNLYFMYKMMTPVLPWTVCNQSWNTPNCISNSQNGTGKTVAASEEFWKHNVLEITPGINHLGGLRVELLVCLTICWLIVFLCLIRGIKSSGKVVYVTAAFPYVVLTILLVRGLTLPGAMDGIKFYLVPDWEQLTQYKVWGRAAVQIFYSVGMAWGSLITMSSYNVFNNNVKRDALLVPLINCGTSIFAGFVIFSVIGYLAHVTGRPIETVVTQGPGLTFVVYPQAAALMPLAHLWAMLFFLMIFALGLDSQFSMFETVTSAFIDEYPALLRRKKFQFTVTMCLVEYILGIPLVFQSGIYVLTIIDYYCSAFSLMLLALMECLIITWIYGVDRFSKDIELMIGTKPNWLWQITWKFFTPAIVLFIWLFSLISMENVEYGDYIYPTWAILFGWMLGLMSAAPIPIWIVILIAKQKHGTFFQKLRYLTQPSAAWGPARSEDRDRYFESMTTYDRERYQAAHMQLDHHTFVRMYDSSDPIGDWDAWLRVLKKKEMGRTIGNRFDPRYSYIETSINEGK